MTGNMILIAEFGMCHNGSLSMAKDLVRVAKESGATLVKGQAFMAHDVQGSMPPQFYKDRQLNLWQLVELIEYGRGIGIEVFYSIFSQEFEPLMNYQKWMKFAAVQSRRNPRWVEQFDKFNTIASVNPGTWLPNLKKSEVLFATPYLTKFPGLHCIEFLTEYYGRQVGYSDHTIGVDWCIRAAKEYGARVIEKHFVLDRDIYFEGKQFRDAVHGATPDEFAKLARAVL